VARYLSLDRRAHAARHAELAGLKTNFNDIGPGRSARLISQLVEASDIEKALAGPIRWPILIDGWKNRGLSPETCPTERLMRSPLARDVSSIANTGTAESAERR